MIIVRIQSGVVVEILLDVDDVGAVLCEQLSDARGVGSLVARNIVAVQYGGEPSHIECHSVERALRRCRQSDRDEAEEPD